MEESFFFSSLNKKRSFVCLFCFIFSPFFCFVLFIKKKNRAISVKKKKNEKEKLNRLSFSDAFSWLNPHIKFPSVNFNLLFSIPEKKLMFTSMYEKENLLFSVWKIGKSISWIFVCLCSSFFSPFVFVLLLNLFFVIFLSRIILAKGSIGY